MLLAKHLMYGIIKERNFSNKLTDESNNENTDDRKCKKMINYFFTNGLCKLPNLYQ